MHGVDTLFIYDTNDKLIDMRLFRVKPIPDPVARIGEYCGNATISKIELLAQSGLKVLLPIFDFDIFLKSSNFK